MDGWEWNGWLAFHSIEPFGPLREDLRAGKLCAVTASTWGGKHSAEDFFSTLRDDPIDSKPGSVVSGFLHLCPAMTPMQA